MAYVAKRTVEIDDPPLARYLFNRVDLAWAWLLLRLYLGWQWLDAARYKLGDPQWMQTGEAVKTFWQRAIAIPPPPATPPITVDWYRSFVELLLDRGAYTWFARLVAVGEALVGVLLIVGLFTGVAAFVGGFMNWSFMMAGVAGANPLLFAIATWLVLAWKVAGYWGLDRWALPALGTPWHLGTVFVRRRDAVRAAGPA